MHHDHQRPSGDRGQHVGSVVRGHRDNDLDRRRRRGEHALGAARDRLDGSLPDDGRHAAVGDAGCTGRRVGHGVHVDHLAALEARRHVPRLHGKGQLHELGGPVQRGARQQLTRPDGTPQRAALRPGARGEVGVRGVAEPDVDGAQVAGVEFGARREVTGTAQTGTVASAAPTTRAPRSTDPSTSSTPRTRRRSSQRGGRTRRGVGPGSAVGRRHDGRRGSDGGHSARPCSTFTVCAHPFRADAGDGLSRADGPT